MEERMAQAKGYGTPHGYNVPHGTETYVFQDNGIIPNNSLPLIVRRGAIPPSPADPAKSFETTFRENGWSNSWRNGIHDYHHYHPDAHEVLGIAAGSASVRFGGEDGELVAVTAGDVVIVPAGVGHALINGSDEFLVVGAYADDRDYDTIRDDPTVIAQSRKRIAEVPLPDADPVDGTDGPLMKLWYSGG
jgi:uncharacterized protein YjlB